MLLPPIGDFLRPSALRVRVLLDLKNIYLYTAMLKTFLKTILTTKHVLYLHSAVLAEKNLYDSDGGVFKRQ
jgi:hypothetical protein